MWLEEWTEQFSLIDYTLILVVSIKIQVNGYSTFFPFDNDDNNNNIKKQKIPQLSTTVFKAL